MTVEKVIKKAVDEGWLPHAAWKGISREAIINWSIADHNLPRILLQPAFWEALGKSLGWQYCKLHSFAGSITESEECNDCMHIKWLDKWHDFIDHLAAGGTPKSYFKQIT